MNNLLVINKDIDNIILKIKDSIYKLSGKTVLITGANGFLPSYLVYVIDKLNKTLLKDRPVKLICLTIESEQDCFRIKNILKENYVTHIEQDIGKHFELNFNIDYIIHAASKASPQFYMQDPIGTIDSNVNGTRVLLDYSLKNKVESFLFFSSGEIYGDPDLNNIPTKENYLPKSDWHSVRSCYTESKRFSETLCINYFYKYKIPVKIVRPFHVYGPGLSLNDGRVIADFFKQALYNKDIEILSDGLASRAFCYISDATSMFFKVLLDGENGQVYNVGNDKEQVTIKDLALKIINIFDYNIKLNILNKNISYINTSPNKSCPCVNKLREKFSYEPEINIQDGLNKLKDYYYELNKVNFLKEQAKQIRLSILDMVTNAKSSHIGSAFSIVDILTVLYFNFLNLDLIKNRFKNRDYFILSKGHSVGALYATLAQTGLISKEILKTYYQDNSVLAGHPIKDSLPGIEASTGSLGHGLPMAVGLALASKKDNLGNKIYCLLGDGECQEGSVWEALLLASRFKLNNLVIIIDNNKLQGLDRTENLVLNLEEKFKAFNLNIFNINGHNYFEIINSLKNTGLKDTPDVIIANSIKGYGVSFMQDKLEWHYKSPNNQEYLAAKQELIKS